MIYSTIQPYSWVYNLTVVCEFTLNIHYINVFLKYYKPHYPEVVALDGPVALTHFPKSEQTLQTVTGTVFSIIIS